jgi:uncharacterized hydrophobic protein (TIGR00271 family)
MDENGQQVQPPSRVYLIHDTTLEMDALPQAPDSVELLRLRWAEREQAPVGARTLLFLSDEQLRDLAPVAVERRWEVGVLPHPEAKETMGGVGVKGSLEQVFQYYFTATPIEADTLLCNDQYVFSSVVIGQVLSLRPYDLDRPTTRRSFFVGAFRRLGKLRPRSYKLVTGKDQKVNLAALGLVVVGHTQSTLMGRSFADVLSISDGRLTLLALSPRSVLAYIVIMTRFLFREKLNLSKLPPSIGLIQSDSLHVEAPGGVDYLLDGKPIHAEELEFRVPEQTMMLLPGPAMVVADGNGAVKDKDIVRTKHLPVDETAKQLVGKNLPLFSHATEEEYRELFSSLRESAMPSSSYQVLTVLSMLLALFGMYANSAPVIIGAMILAPLMAPIISLAMGMARIEPNLIKNSLRTLLIGVAWGLGCAVLVAWLMPLEHLTSEMQVRMSPTLLDLSVAVVSGVAGAYAFSREEIAKSLAGVAIAVALVPPLSVAGIGIGWARWEMAQGAILLFTTNLIGIALAASATFLVLGFAPFKLARKGLAISLALMALIIAPLYIGFSDLVMQESIMNQVPTDEIELTDARVSVRNVSVSSAQPPVVRLVVSSREVLEPRHIDELKQIIVRRVGQPVELDVQFSLRR